MNSSREPVPRVTPSSRQLIHLSFCRAVGGCRYVGGHADDEQRRFCSKLDTLLDYNDEMLLHAKAFELNDDLDRMGLLSAVRDPGIEYAIRAMDPYEKIEAFTAKDDEVNLMAKRHPDCPSCVAGRAHYHRKTDGQPVRRPT